MGMPSQGTLPLVSPCSGTKMLLSAPSKDRRAQMPLRRHTHQLGLYTLLSLAVLRNYVWFVGQFCPDKPFFILPFKYLSNKPESNSSA